MISSSVLLPVDQCCPLASSRDAVNAKRCSTVTLLVRKRTGLLDISHYARPSPQARSERDVSVSLVLSPIDVRLSWTNELFEAPCHCWSTFPGSVTIRMYVNLTSSFTGTAPFFFSGCFTSHDSRFMGSVERFSVLRTRARICHASLGVEWIPGILSSLNIG